MVESNTRTPSRVDGGKICIFGDLHLSIAFNGQHISYGTECYENMERIKEICKEEKPSAIIFLGDLIGVTERNIRDRQFLMRVMQFFEYLNVVTEGKVYSVKGNHDIGDFSDYDFLVGMGLIKNPKYIDYYNDERGWEVRFHLVNYGHENEKLAITEATDAVSNVVLGHADYYIDGVTNWYSAKGGVELSKLGNFCGVELVISGHIHIPSTEILYTTLKDGNSIGIFYTGSPSRVAERFDDCWYVTFEFNETGTECNQKLMNLKPAKDVFYPKEQFDLDLVDDEEIMSKEKSEKLTLLVKDIIESRLTTGDIVSQIKSIPGFDDETKNLATDYYQKAENGGK
jgi:predicted phosphodiesterase